ncbi:MAG: BNR repeat-containing protein [Planctomycetota bacterium]
MRPGDHHRTSPPSRLQLVALLLLPACALSARAGGSRWEVTKTHDLGRAWAGHPVGFAFAIRGDREYVGWYDADRRMTFAQRKLGSDEWTVHRTNEVTGWDSHNRIALAFDRGDHLHVAANMHCSRLRYWRSKKPEDVTSLRPVHRMTGHENGCTYPRFLHDKEGGLLFLFRIGGSGRGRRYVNVYDEETRTWSRLLKKPLLSGREGKTSMNAYPIGLRTDAAGVVHLAWVWRNTPDCSTNHDLCYARSKDFKTWTTSSGETLDLPITLENAEVVDPVPVKGGLANFGGGLAFDQEGRPMITYIKFDKAGKTQVYAARLEDGKWARRQVTEWDYRWFFRGGGSIRSEISWSALRLAGNALVFSYRHTKLGPGRYRQRFDPKTLEPIGEPVVVTSPWPAEVRKARSDFPDMRVHLRGRRPGGAEGKRRIHLLRWETLPQNRDRPRKKFPPPGKLQLIELERK